MRRLAAISLVFAAFAVVTACSPSRNAETPTSAGASTTPESTEVGKEGTTTTTIPADPDELGALVVFGDWGSGTLPQGAVAGAVQRFAEANQVDAILTTGDNFYDDEVSFLLFPYKWSFEAGIPWWVTWGNHDVESDARVDAMNHTFDDPPRWTTHRWGPIDIVILDSNEIANVEQAAYFAAETAASTNPTIVVMHHPPFSCSHSEETTTLVRSVVDLIDEDVFLVLAGHDHNYQRFNNLDVDYVVTGGGGADLRPISECPDGHPELVVGAELNHFLTLEVNNGSLSVEAIDVNGDVFDSFDIELP